MEKIFVGIASALILLNPLSCISVAETSSPFPVEKALQVVSERGSGFGNMSLSELQTACRLLSVLYQWHYKYEEKDSTVWLDCMNDANRSVYARLCAAYFLLDQQKDARDFVMSQLKSENLRYRYNAAKVVELYVGRDPHKSWGVDLLIGLLGSDALDGNGVISSPEGEYPEGDRDDIMETPIDSICRDLGFMREQKAVSALISVLERRPGEDGAAFALGEIGNKQAIPTLMKLLKDSPNCGKDVVKALGKLKVREAVPVLNSRLNRPHTGVFATEAVLEALLEIGDPSAVKPIQDYLNGDSPEREKAVAKRVLVQLNSPDPVATLLDLFEKETYEPERSRILFALAMHTDGRVETKLTSIASSSDSAFMRREAIFALRNIGDRPSLLALASLLDLSFPHDLKAEWGWKGTPDFREYFPETIQECLKERTQQDFGKDRRKWEDWIKSNIKP